MDKIASVQSEPIYNAFPETNVNHPREARQKETTTKFNAFKCGKTTKGYIGLEKVSEVEKQKRTQRRMNRGIQRDNQMLIEMEILER